MLDKELKRRIQINELAIRLLVLPSLPIVGETRKNEELVLRVEKELSP